MFRQKITRLNVFHWEMKNIKKDTFIIGDCNKKVQVGKDQEKAQSEKDSHSKNTKLTIRYLYHETYRKPNEQLFSQ